MASPTYKVTAIEGGLRNGLIYILSLPWPSERSGLEVYALRPWPSLRPLRLGRGWGGVLHFAERRGEERDEGPGKYIIGRARRRYVESTTEFSGVACKFMSNSGLTIVLPCFHM